MTDYAYPRLLDFLDEMVWILCVVSPQAALPALTPEEVTLVNKALPKAPDDLLMPGNWHDKPSFAGSFNAGLLKDTK